MLRRDFLRLTGIAGFIPSGLGGAVLAPADSSTTILYDEHSTVVQAGAPSTRSVRDGVESAPSDARAPEALWVHKRDLPKINAFEIKPQGACRDDLCIPLSRDMIRGDYFDLTAFARKIGQPVVADRDARVWSFGEMQAVGGGFLSSRIAPDFAVPDRKGRPVHLSDFRGTKVLLVTWASW